MKFKRLKKRWRQKGRGIFDEACHLCATGRCQECEDIQFIFCGCWRDWHEEDFENPPGAATERRVAYAAYTKGLGPDPRKVAT